MLVLGIESSAHTIGVGIVENGRILANEKKMYRIGVAGIIPAKVASFHAKNVRSVIASAVKRAGISLSDIDGIGYTKGPGIGPCLQVGELAAKALASSLHVRIAAVNHGVAHIEIAKHEARLKDPVALYVSGGNSQILKLSKSPIAHYQVLGETFDIGIGNMLDSFARALKLNPAWGSSIALMAAGGNFVRLPYTVKGMDFSFTGLLTKAKSLIGRESPRDLCFSIQEVSFSMLTEATERALLLTNSKELCVCGGVAQSKRLKEMLSIMAKSHRIKFGYASDELNADNGAMIAYVAERMLANGYSTPLRECNVQQRYRVDQFDMGWVIA
ncbi:MAG: KEOPS complex N(6)-L-threonylcarbamoyladenine synthase Kae1 [Candidatus Micrarchaeaceae archaeon]